MNQKRAYLGLKERQRKEFEAFPIAYAFNEEQLRDALDILGATREECVSVTGMGDIIRKEDVPAYKAMLLRHVEELHEALEDEEFAEAAFSYEMDNHEYCINWDGDADIFACFCLTEKQLEEKNLVGPYRRARKAHYNRFQEYGLI